MNMKLDITPAVKDLLYSLVNAGFVINEIEVDGEHHKPPPSNLDHVVLHITEGRMTDIGMTSPNRKDGAWLRIITDNEPCAIVNDYGVPNDALEKVVDAHSKRWEDCSWVPVPTQAS